MRPESVKEFYNRQYTYYGERHLACPNALGDLDKARRRVGGVVRRFGLSGLHGARALDVGSGLGYYTKALSLVGASVTGIDFSDAAIAAARKSFPECAFRCGSWPEDIAPEPDFDLIWMVNFSQMNTFDVGFIEERLVGEAIRRLSPGGALVVGWNSDFSGRVIGGYSHWSFGMLKALRERCGLSDPFVVEVRIAGLVPLAMMGARALRRSVPIFMVRREPRPAATATAVAKAAR
jgi:SAM-dependent methyltransferase